MKMVVNGDERDIENHSETSLLLFLRNILGLIGTKQGCSMGECRACLVLVGDRPTTSCDVRLGDLEGRETTTIEAVCTTAEGRAVAEAMLEHNAGQCGYCLSDIIVAAAAALSGDPARLRDETVVRTTLDANLCRCGAHQRIIDAVVTAAERLRPEDGL